MLLLLSLHIHSPIFFFVGSLTIFSVWPRQSDSQCAFLWLLMLQAVSSVERYMKPAKSRKFSKPQLGKRKKNLSISRIEGQGELARA